MAFELTKEFLEKILRQPILSFTVKAGSKPGDNVQGDLKAVTVETAGGKTLHLVHKIMSPDPAMRQIIVDFQTFRIEIDFYMKIAPEIEAFIKTRCDPNDSNLELPIPQFYDGFNNDTDDYLTMEDLRPSGYRMADKFVGLGSHEVTVFMKAVGRFHAFSYCYVKFNGEKVFDTIHPRIGRPFYLDPVKAEEFKMMFKGCADYIPIMAARNFPEEIVEKLRKKLGEITPGVETSLKTDRKYFPLMIHADLWVNNIMFRYDENGKAVDAKFIDFQSIRRGSIFEDLLYFFFTSTTPEFRHQHLHASLNVYWNSFTSSLAAGCT